MLIVSRHHFQGIYLGRRRSSHVYIGANCCVGKKCVKALPHYSHTLELQQAIFHTPLAKFLFPFASVLPLQSFQHCQHFEGKLTPTFRPLCTSLWMSRKGSLISSRSWLSILTIPSLSRTKSRWDPSPQCTTATGCLRPLNTSWAQQQLCLCFLGNRGDTKGQRLMVVVNNPVSGQRGRDKVFKLFGGKHEIISNKTQTIVSHKKKSLTLTCIQRTIVYVNALLQLSLYNFKQETQLKVQQKSSLITPTSIS